MGHAELGPEDIDDKISPLHGAIKRTWSSFCATSSIHGLKFTRDEEANTIIKLVWYLITIIMFMCAIIMVVTFYMDYRSNPTRMNVENDHAPISSLFFPAITICPEVLYNPRKSEKYLKSIRMPPSVTQQNVLDGLSISHGFMIDDVRYESHEVELMQSVLDLNNLTLVEFTRRIQWNCDELIYRCRFRDRVRNCSELFTPSRSFYGNCCGFNVNQIGVNFTAERATHHGLWGGLSIILRYSADLGNSNSYSRGFKLMLHENKAFPSAHAVSKFVALNTEIFLSVRPVETFCSSAVRHLSSAERNCVFPEEHILRHFESYVGANCELNCRVQNMVKFCGCLTFFFNNNMTHDRVCTYTDIPCLVENFAQIIGRQRKLQCPCPNSCEMVNYDVQLTSTQLQMNISAVNDFYTGIENNFSVAHIFMNSQVYRRVKRDLLSNTVTLISNLGSAFSLFVGMSMVSAVEIIYFFSVILRKFYVQEVKAREKLMFSKTVRVETVRAIDA